MSQSEIEVITDLITAVLKEFICETNPTTNPNDPSAILVFLPGWEEISKTQNALKDSHYFGDSSMFQILALHSTLPASEQRLVFQRPPTGCRKIILSTNVAETSLTIDDVVCVVDLGMCREKRYKAGQRATSLDAVFCARANIRQRRGRAGRVQPGTCFHLYSRREYDNLQEFSIPEILRTPLHELCLQTKVYDFNTSSSIAEFLRYAITPPPRDMVHDALMVLQEVGALTSREELTPLGRVLGTLPIDPRIGKFLVMSTICGVLDPALTVAAAWSCKSPFVAPMHAREEANAIHKDLFLKDMLSDSIMVVNAYQAWLNAEDQYRFAKDSFLSHATLKQMKSIRNQLGRLLCNCGLVDDLPPESTTDIYTQYAAQFLNLQQRFIMSDQIYDKNTSTLMMANRNTGNHEVFKSVLVSGMYPNIAFNREKKEWCTKDHKSITAHPSTCMKSAHKLGSFNSPWVVFGEKTKGFQAGSSRETLYMRDCSMVSAEALLFFAKPFEVVMKENRINLVVDELISIEVPNTETANALYMLRTLFDKYVTERMLNTWKVNHGMYGGRLLEMIAELVSLSEGNSHHPSKDPSQFPQSLPSPSPSPSPPPIEPPQSSYQSSSRSSKPFQKVRVDQSRSRPSHSQNYQKSRMIDHHTSQSDHHHTSSHQSDHHISHMTDHGQSQHKADSGHQSIEQQNMMYQQQMNQQMMINQQMNQQMFQQQQINANQNWNQGNFNQYQQFNQNSYPNPQYQGGQFHGNQINFL